MDLDLRRAGAAGRQRDRKGGDRVGDGARARRRPRPVRRLSPVDIECPPRLIEVRAVGKPSLRSDGFLLIELNQLRRSGQTQTVTSTSSRTSAKVILGSSGCGSNNYRGS
jgi:hypothetical protein